MIKNQMSFRYAERKDAALILKFIKELARYEKLESEVIATEPLLEGWTVYRIDGDTLRNMSG